MFQCGDPRDFARLVFGTLHSRQSEEEGMAEQRGGVVSFKDFLTSLSAVAQGTPPTKLECTCRTREPHPPS